MSLIMNLSRWLLKTSLRVNTMKKSIKRCNGIDYSFAFKVGFNSLVNKDSLILCLMFDW